MGSWMASLYHRKLAHHNISLWLQESVRLTTIDLYTEQNNINTIHLLKIDIEGHELQCLLGAQRMISEDQVLSIQFEFGGTDIDSRSFFKDFRDLLHEKYHIYRILHNWLYEIKKYSEYNEIFQCVNYLCIHKSLWKK